MSELLNEIAGHNVHPCDKVCKALPDVSMMHALRLSCFSDVQLSLDVRGKSTLEESLDLYVQGELMEGDNQYLCEEAGKKVCY